jgi:hypothetical protein
LFCERTPPNSHRRGFGHTLFQGFHLVKA